MKKLKEIKKIELPDAVKKLNGRSAKRLKRQIQKLDDAVDECHEECIKRDK